MREREWIRQWIGDLLHHFETDDVGLLTAINTLVHTRKIRRVLSGMYFNLFNHHKCLHFLITITFFVGQGADYAAALEVCINIKNTLSVIKVPERYSGVTTGILKAAVGDGSGILATSKLLQV